MGHKAQVQRQRNSQFDRERRGRDHRKEHAKKQRRGDVEESESRKIQQVYAEKRPDPSSEQRKILVAQMAAAARIPGAAHDLILVLDSTCASKASLADRSTYTRGKRRVTDDEGDDGESDAAAAAAAAATPVVISSTAASTLKIAVKAFTSKLPDLVVDELGSRCLVTLLGNLTKYHANAESAAGVATAEEMIAAIFALKDEEEFKAKYLNGEDEDGHGIELDDIDADALEPMTRPKLDLLNLASHHNGRAVVWAMITNGSKSQQKKIAEAVLPISQNLATHRHGSITLLRLLEAGEKNAAILSAKLLPFVPTLLGDAVGFNVAAALINNSNRQQIFKSLGAPQHSVMKLIADKRGNRFLIRLLTLAEDTKATEDAIKLVSEIAEQVSSVLIEKFMEMATDRQGNFLLQAVIKASSKAPQLQKKIFSTLGADLVYLARHHIGVHVVLTLVSHGDPKVVRVPLNASLNQSLVNLVSDQYGSLVVRALLEKVDHSTYLALETHIDSLIVDPSGNLVIQQLIKGLTPLQLQGFVTKHIKKNLITLCQHKFAAHVVYNLLDVVDPQTHNELCALLKPHVLSLAVHVSGRFVVEKLVGLFKDARTSILTSFLQMADAQGTQNLLTLTFMASDAAAKKTLVTSTIIPNVVNLSCSKTSSIVLQKMIQGETSAPGSGMVLVPALKSHFAAHNGLAESLSRDFMGRFVAELVARA